ncbi:hypothetical protein Tco_1070740 [Tanacetum coccineum]|uniref:Uncharacterized protein n=1 Tax=Tanacetum coccineum TaxID=301880 RepID=A0ABQ5HME2_9ASTR
MSSITAQQTKLDLELVPKDKRLKIGKCNRRLNPEKIQREPTFQVVLDALTLTPCYFIILITADVLEVYMHQFRDSVYKHDTFYRFKIDKRKRFKLNMEIFRDIFKICPRVHGQDFDALPTDEEIMSFLRDLGHTREINLLNDVVVDQMHQPWRTILLLALITNLDWKDNCENLDVTTVVTPSNDKTVENKGVSNTVESNAVRMNNTSAPIIEDWNSDDEMKLSTASTSVNTVRPVNTANTKAVNTVRSVNTAASKSIMNHPRTKTNAFKRGYSQSSRPFNRYFANKNSIINTNVNTAKVKHTTAMDRAVVSENKGKGANAVKASACWV